MASALLAVSRALAARSAAVPRAVIRARPALEVSRPGTVAGVRFFSRDRLEWRRRTMVLKNVPYTMSLEQVKDQVDFLKGFYEIKPLEGKQGQFTVEFDTRDNMRDAKGMFLSIFWMGRQIVAMSMRASMEECSPPSKGVYVTGIPFNATDEQLHELFKGLGNRPKIKVPKSQLWEGYIGYAIVGFETVEAAAAARELLQGRLIGGRKVFADFSHKDPPGTRPPGQFKARMESEWQDQPTKGDKGDRAGSETRDRPQGEGRRAGGSGTRDKSQGEDHMAAGSGPRDRSQGEARRTAGLGTRDRPRGGVWTPRDGTGGTGGKRAARERARDRPEYGKPRRLRPELLEESEEQVAVEGSARDAQNGAENGETIEVRDEPSKSASVEEGTPRARDEPSKAQPVEEGMDEGKKDGS